MNRWFDNIPIIGKKYSGKIVLSFLMLVLAAILAIVYRTSDRCVCFFAMLFAFEGDWVLNSGKTPEMQTNKIVVLGGSCFMLAHFWYACTYFLKIYFNKYPFVNGGTYILLMILLFVTVYFIFNMGKSKNLGMFWFGVLYLWLTSISYFMIFSYSASVKSIESLAVVGGLMFLASDVIIGCEKFLGLRSKLARELVWWLYPIGQTLIIIFA